MLFRSTTPFVATEFEMKKKFSGMRYTKTMELFPLDDQPFSVVKIVRFRGTYCSLHTVIILVSLFYINCFQLLSTCYVLLKVDFINSKISLLPCIFYVWHVYSKA